MYTFIININITLNNKFKNICLNYIGNVNFLAHVNVSPFIPECIQYKYNIAIILKQYLKTSGIVEFIF